MASDLQELADRLEATSRRLLQVPSDAEQHRILLQLVHRLSTLSPVADLPLFIRSIAKDVESSAIQVARAIEAGQTANLASSIGELEACLRELQAALGRGRA